MTNTQRSAPLISLRGITRTFASPAGAFTALDDVTMTIDPGEFTVISGQSGSGKSTLLGLISGIDRPTKGEVFVNSTAVHSLSERATTEWRGKTVGIVFQFFQLLPTLTTIENVMLPMDFCSTWPQSERRDRAMAILTRLGIADQADKFPSRLSGGQQQRAAIARALANEPKVLLADEPTGNLDGVTATLILDLFASLARDGQTIVMVSHDPAAASRASRSIKLVNGRIADGAPS